MGWLKNIFGGKSGEINHGGDAFDAWVTQLREKLSSDAFDSLTVAELQAQYRKNALVFRCVWEIATSAAEPPLVVGRADGEDFEPAVGHWAQDLLDRPNDDYDQGLFVEYISSRKLLTGESYVLKFSPEGGATSMAGPIAQLWPVPTSWIEVVTGDGLQPITGYKLDLGHGRKSNLEKDAVLRMYYPDPNSVWKAASPLRAAENDVQLDTQRENYVGEMLSNIVVPGFAITAPHGMTPEQKADLKRSIQDRAGKGHRGGTILFEGEGMSGQMFNPLADLDMPGLISMTESRICMVFGVPPELVGARTGLDKSTYSNKAEARESFYENTMIPFWRSLQGGLTRGLLRNHNDWDYDIRFDLSRISALQDVQAKRAERFVELYEAGIITLEEARSAQGYPEEIPAGHTLSLLQERRAQLLDQQGGSRE